MIEDIKYKLNLNNSEKPSGRPQASVLIAILNYGEFIESPELIYTQRSSHLSTHSGEVSFPGGKADKTDPNLFGTALRESNEEISLNSKDVTELGKLNYLISRHKIEVNPFVASVDQPQTFEPNEEIQEIFTVPLNFCLTQETFKEKALKDMVVFGKCQHGTSRIRKYGV